MLCGGIIGKIVRENMTFSGVGRCCWVERVETVERSRASCAVPAAAEDRVDYTETAVAREMLGIDREANTGQLQVGDGGVGNGDGV